MQTALWAEDALVVAAKRQEESHHLVTNAPRPITSWKKLQALGLWFEGLQSHCLKAEEEASKAAEWLLDNNYQIVRAVRQIREDLPASFYRRLPAIIDRRQQAVPRPYALAHGLLDASHMQLSLQSAITYVQAYQEHETLNIAELWALPTMLRLALLEALVIAALDVFPDLKSPFEETLELEAPAPMDPTERIARALVGLQTISSISWKDFFDRTSHVELTLSRDPAGVYLDMDFETRDQYRKAVEELSDGTDLNEVTIAERVVSKAHDQKPSTRARHVGFWLIDDGRPELESLVGFRAPLRSVAPRFIKRHPGSLYASSLVFFGIAALVLPWLYLASNGATLLTASLGILLSILPASILSVTVVNWIFTLILAPRVLPKLDFDDGIPGHCRTAVIMPVIVGSVDEAKVLVDRLEGHMLTNPAPELQFVVLSDHIDAPTETLPTDKPIEAALISGIEALNTAHANSQRPRFVLLHRPRRYNDGETCWMAWERKRGKIEQFNRLVLTGDESGFSLHVGDLAALKDIRFVITLDADTVLPMGAATRLIGTIAHPLNQAEFDEFSGALRHGFTVVQPRVEACPEAGARSAFHRFFTGDNAIDIYSNAVSNVYQDLFGSAVYVGKGIYDVAAFDRSLAGRVPDNALLSHDLFEGAHGRAALASDIIVFDGYPATYPEYAKRWHRWVRGDWQLLPWLASCVPGQSGQKLNNRLSRLDRWKIFDNLRRSAIPIGLVVLAIAGWFILPGSAWVWTLLTVIAPGAYLFTELASGISRGRRREVIQHRMHQLLHRVGRWALAVAFMLFEAVVALDAITRTLWRLFVSRRHRLEWTSAAHANTGMRADAPRRYAWSQMWATSVGSVTLAVLIGMFATSSLIAASPLLVVWLLAPEIATWVSDVRRRPVETLGEEETLYLRRVARRTWLFFETFVGPEDHWLPPDNFQEDPHPLIAHRTSPTNIGLMLTSSLMAWDLGYVTSTDLALRTGNALDSLNQLDRYRGHFLNWYDTRTLDPLEPRYVSTVDSGNLAVSLITHCEGCRDVANAPVLRRQQWRGLLDTVDMLSRALEPTNRGELSHRVASQMSVLAEIIDLCSESHPDTWWVRLVELSEQAWPGVKTTIGEALNEAKDLPKDVLRDINVGIDRVNHDLSRLKWSLEHYLPWLDFIDNAPVELQQVETYVAKKLSPSMPLCSASEACSEVLSWIADHKESLATDTNTGQWVESLCKAIETGAERQVELHASLLDHANHALKLAKAMDFSLVYDEDQRLFHIGYNMSSDRMDPHHYDLLASEARLASYFAIAKGDVSPEHWRVLGRPVTRHRGQLSLLSWNGSMFEYLMPSLWLRSSEETLLHQSEKTAVDIQRAYAEQVRTPWGISESGFSMRDAMDHYQYQAFGVPGLGLRRGLSQDLVISPYATMLALAVYPASAISNLKELESAGLFKRFGFVEAADYTRERSQERSFALVHSYMAHHQGMAFTSIGNVLTDDIMVRRFASNKQMQSAALLLEERTPWEVPSEPKTKEPAQHADAKLSSAPTLHPWAADPGSAVRQFQILGNGRFSSWIRESGSGALWWHQDSLTRWRPDCIQDNHGLWLYVRDLQSDALWSMGEQPTGSISSDAHVQFHQHMVEFHRRDHGIAMRMDVGVAAGDDLEIRLITMTNETDRPRTLQVTSYGEVALAPLMDDERHPAFSKVFVESRHIERMNGVMFTRRARQQSAQSAVMLHRLVFDDASQQSCDIETDRRAFLGRGGQIRRPLGVIEGLSNSTGWTLDPVMALQTQVNLAPRERRQFAVVTIAAGSEDTVQEIAERYTTLASLEWALDDARRETAQHVHRLDIAPPQLPTIQTLGSLVLDPQRNLRAPVSLQKQNRLGQSGLWPMGISGDLPIILLLLGDLEEEELLRTLLKAQRLLLRGLLKADLVILRTGDSGYIDTDREQLLALIQELGLSDRLGRNGGIHLVFADQKSDADTNLLMSAAAVVLRDSGGDLERQFARLEEAQSKPPFLEPSGHPEASDTDPQDEAEPTGLTFQSELGGFDEPSGEYLIDLKTETSTPCPWSNILANDQFGCLVTESGGGFTWAENSGENRLSPWTNDPVSDPPSEALYLRDEETATVWTPLPSPIGSGATCRVRHGAGYTSWRTSIHGLDQTVTVFVSPDDPVKIVKVRLRDKSNCARRITATYYIEWLLGSIASAHQQHVVAEYDAGLEALLARNHWNFEFADRIAFLLSDCTPHSLTTDRRDFIGQGRDLSQPEGLARWDLAGRTENVGNACGAYQVHIDMAAGEVQELHFVIGQGRDADDSAALIRKWKDPQTVDEAYERTCATWRDKLGRVQVKTPDAAFNIMMNHWLLYQADASRILARAGFYQAGGAFGFRDQLQDMLAILHTEPARVRAHILDCAARQFEEGDVLHWWHPPSGRGVRTRCSDDLLWLPYVTGKYVKATGDLSILEEPVPFLMAPPLSPEEGDRYAEFERSEESATLFEHCVRAIERGSTQGPNGLPLIGAGDWNDGMDRVGEGGKGESVWLAWFVIATITGFADIAEQLGRSDLRQKWTAQASTLQTTIDKVAWDGAWYIRAFDDDGVPWGSSKSEECQIDSIAQSWAVLSSGTPSARAQTAIRSVLEQLVSDEDRLVRLFWPPIHDTPRDPGYIKSYPPGIRENGGQYTHAATWLGLALAKLGDGDGAWRIFDYINPIRRTISSEDIERYRNEPYVLSADIGGVPPYVGRGGWSWYTGAAAWTWRLGLEGILGVSWRDGEVIIDPCLPKAWGSAKVEIKGPEGAVAFDIHDPDHLGRGALEIRIGDKVVTEPGIKIPEDGSVLNVKVTIKPLDVDQSSSVTLSK
ncbi:MAG: glucoamylase family protein [Henriciella sp.]|nr:glucoamylase family protein [Henriciella sp.]